MLTNISHKYFIRILFIVCTVP